MVDRGQSYNVSISLIILLSYHTCTYICTSPRTKVSSHRRGIDKRLGLCYFKTITNKWGVDAVNNTRRKAIAELATKLEALKSDLETIRDEEQEYLDNMPESLQDSERADDAEAAVESLEAAGESLEESISALGECDYKEKSNNQTLTEPKARELVGRGGE